MKVHIMLPLLRLNFVALCVAIVLAACPKISLSESLEFTDLSNIRAVIREQLSAFEQGDARKAFETASMEVRTEYKSPDNFMHMIRHSYMPLLSIKQSRFQGILRNLNRPVQLLTFTEKKGDDWIVAFHMVKSKVGLWKIDNVVMGRIEGLLV